MDSEKSIAICLQYESPFVRVFCWFCGFCWFIWPCCCCMVAIFCFSLYSTWPCCKVTSQTGEQTGEYSLSQTVIQYSGAFSQWPKVRRQVHTLLRIGSALPRGFAFFAVGISRHLLLRPWHDSPVVHAILIFLRYSILRGILADLTLNLSVPVSAAKSEAPSAWNQL